jgi:hypothetical protein
MTLTSERRRHPRYDMTLRECRLALLEESGGLVEEHDCKLVNLSFSGMCFHSQQELQQGEERRFVIDLRSGVPGAIVVKAQIRWAQASELPAGTFGAVFLESSRGWLGPEEDNTT